MHKLSGVEGPVMHRRIRWLKPSDKEILGFLFSDYWVTTKVLAANSGFSSVWLHNRLDEYEARGLVDVRGNGSPLYRLTELGRRVRDGEISVDELRDKTVSDDGNGDAAQSDATE